jgi:uncharacterized membrane protein
LQADRIGKEFLMAHIKESILIAAPVDKVHAYAADIENWPTWYVGLREVSMDGQNVPGTVIQVTYVLSGVHVEASTRITEHGQDAAGAWHWKAEADKGWQAWDYLPKDDGTVVEVEMELAIPWIAARFFKGAFRQTLQNLKQRTEASNRPRLDGVSTVSNHDA